METEEIFRYKTPDKDKLAKAGFLWVNGAYEKDFSVMDGQFTVTVRVDDEVTFKVTETEFGEEYVPVRIGAVGGFVGEVRQACFEVLNAVAKECFTELTFKTEQTKRLVVHISSEYGVEPEFLWKDCTHAVFRRKNDAKWFGIIMDIPREKLGLDGSGNIEIINLKDIPSEVAARVDGKVFFKAYHMNKTHWYSLRLDGQISDEEAFNLVERSIRSLRK